MSGRPSDWLCGRVAPISLEDYWACWRLAPRTQQLLVEAGIRSIGELSHRSDRELLLMKGFGRRALYEVIAMLAFHGLKIRREPGW